MTGPDRLARRIVFVAGLYVTVAGVLSFAGWAVDIRRLTDWADAGVSTQPNTAIAGAAAGLALVLVALRRGRAAAILGTLTGLIGAVAILEHASGVDFGVDALFLFGREWGRAATLAPGRMGRPGAVAWTLVGATFVLLLGGRRSRMTAAMFGVVVTGIAALSLTGSLFGADALYTLPRLTAIALQTSSMLFVLGLGLLVAVPEREPLRSLLEASAAGVLVRRMLPFVIFMPLALGLLRLAGQRAGLYDTSMGAALLVLALVAFLGVVLWWGAAAVRRHEGELARTAEHARQAIAASEERYRSLVSIIVDVPWTTDAEGAFVTPQAEWTAYTGQSWDAQRGFGWLDAVHPEDRPRVRALREEATRTGRTYEAGGRLWHAPSGEYRHFLARATPLRNAAGVIREWVGMCTDVHDAKRREWELRARTGELQAVFDAAPVCIWLARDPRCDVVEGNPAANELLGVPGGNVSSSAPEGRLLDLRHFRHGVAVPVADLPLQKAVATRLPVLDDEIELELADGRRVALVVNAVPLVDWDGSVRGGIAAAVDITERKRTEMTLVEQTRLLELVAAGVSTDEAMIAVSEAIERLSPGVRACILLTDAGRTRIERSFASSIPSSFGRGIEGAAIGEIAIGDVVACRDVATDVRWAPRWRELCLDHRIRASYSAPIVTPAGSSVGAVLLCFDAPRAAAESERRLAELGAQVASIALERDRARLAELELLEIAERARAEAERANQAKDEFLAMLGHELRNPLSAVRNAVATASLDQSHRGRALEIARRQTDQLGRLVDDLLDVARITRGRIPLRKQQVALADVLQRAEEAVREWVDERGHRLVARHPDDSIKVDADPARLEQVIVNLLSNAAKYTEPGGTIDLSAERDGDEVLIRVRDTGMGIAAHVLPRVFDLFAQADRSLDRAQGGLGIGLTVARRLVELHGGSIDARSEGPGRGAEFIVRLPVLPPAPRDENAPDSVVAPGTAVGTSRVLLVEDNHDAAESLSLLLELLGHRVRVAHDGVAAIEAASASAPDVMLIDIGLPGMDGYEVARRVRREPTLQRVVLVALTGYGREEDKERSLASGFDHHLVKPVDPESLGDLIRRLGSEAVVDAPGPQ